MIMDFQAKLSGKNDYKKQNYIFMTSYALMQRKTRVKTQNFICIDDAKKNKS
jgi:hypothetical protein